MALPECKPDRYTDTGFTEAEVERWIELFVQTKPPHHRTVARRVATQHWKDFRPEKDEIHAYMIAPWVRPFIDITLRDRPFNPLTKEERKRIDDLIFERNQLFYKPLGHQILPEVRALNQQIAEIRDNR